MPFCAFSHASYFTLRSGGKTVVTFLFDSVFTWVIVVPAAYLLAHFTGLGDREHLFSGAGYGTDQGDHWY